MTTHGFESSFVRAMVSLAVLERLSQEGVARPTPPPRLQGASPRVLAPPREVAPALWGALSRHGERVGWAKARRYLNAWGIPLPDGVSDDA